MFDNRWDNWSGDFAESFAAGQFDPIVRNAVPEILASFGSAVRAIDREFPDAVSPGTFATVLTGTMARLKLPDSVRLSVPEVVARFLEYLRESGRVGEGDEWAAEVRGIGAAPSGRVKPPDGAKGQTIRNSPKVTPLGRNDPCPCGSGKKFKKCCMSRGE